MVAIPFPTTSAPGHVDHAESGGRLVNLYAEPLSGEQRVKRVRVPGMTSFLTTSETGFRGMMSVGGILYAAFAGELWTGTSAGGAMTFFDSLAGTEPVYFARNNAANPDKIVVTEFGAFQIDPPSSPGNIISYPDVDLPQPNSVFALDGYLVFTIGDGRAFATDLNVTDINQLSFADAEAKADPLVRGVAFAGRALFFGTQSLEIWTDVGASPFPFQRAVIVPFGLLGRDAVAGWEDGFGSGLLWVADDCSVRILDGYTAIKVSPADLDRLITRETDREHLLASVHVVDGHAMWCISGSDFTWGFDLTTKMWHERESHIATRWRGLQSIHTFDRWLIGDRNSGNIYEIDPTNHTEGDDPLRARLESAPVAQFPAQVRVGRADFHLETGVGIANGTVPMQFDPTVEISYSDDGGTTWSMPLLRKMGQQARADKNIFVTRTGMSTRHGRRWRLDVADAVYVSIFAGDQTVELRR